MSTPIANAPTPLGPITKEQLRKGVLNGLTPSAAYDTACTSHAGMVDNPFIQTNRPSTKIFALVDGHATAGSNVAKIHHNVREPACTVDMVPSLKDNSLLSGGKFAYAGYVSVCNDKKMSLYDGKPAKITVSEKAVLTGWRCPKSNLWRIPLVNCVMNNENIETLLLNENFQPQDPRYILPNTAQMLEWINAFTEAPTDTINNVYELPRSERAVCYLHGATGFPTNTTWQKKTQRHLNLMAIDKRKKCEQTFFQV